MAEVFGDIVIPGVYIEVKDEGLIRAGTVSISNVGMVGTAESGDDLDVSILTTFDDAQQTYGGISGGTLVRGLKLAFDNGARTIYAVKTPSGSVDDYEKGLNALLSRDVHLIVTPGASVTDILPSVKAHNEMAENSHRERISIVGCSKTVTDPDALQGLDDDDRTIIVAPGLLMRDGDALNEYSGSYTACAVAGLLSALPPHHSPTNKLLNIAGINRLYNYGELKALINARVLAIEKKSGYRIVKGITTNSGAWKQITTRRIVDYAKYGVRSGSQPYIGRLNNERVRKSLAATLDGFLAGMRQEEMLTEYSLEVSATRDDEIQGNCNVTMTLKPTFSIDYIKVTIYLG
ncbi:phage tail sheath protein [Desulfonema ishimotonii]|uniref:Phage tail sheath protein n=1 Tax=Desulfonema ishimotonii TaxID=45657 RepID=A0A401FWK4_9BACT|nr:phage tail sheath C-terminal domain-containing protein [Desulfonema ishimotonii]GBC61357.1 phage tail sheath protein [Desulfonema ishimotonii]